MSEMLPPEVDPVREECEKALRAAHLCRMRGDHWGALVEAQRACEIEPRCAAAHDLASECAEKVAQWDTAVAHLEQARLLDPDGAARGPRLERLRDAAAVYARPIAEVVADAAAGDADWKTVFRSVFFRPDPVWYQAGWFHQVLAVAGLLLVGLLIHWVLTTGPWIFLLVLLDLAMVAWVAYDAHQHGEPAAFWGVVAALGSLFGFALYLTVRGMGSGIGMQGGNRFFSG